MLLSAYASDNTSDFGVHLFAVSLGAGSKADMSFVSDGSMDRLVWDVTASCLEAWTSPAKRGGTLSLVTP